MTPWRSGGALLAVLALSAEPVLGVHGHWPLGTGMLLGIAGSLLLALGAKTLAGAGLQQPDAGDAEDGA